MTHSEAVTFLAEGRDKTSRPYANNTRIERREGGVALKLHATDVVTFRENGDIVLNSGGWRTLTTKDRMNMGLPAPWRVYTEKGVWYLADGSWSDAGRSVFPYADGITIRADRSVTGAGPDSKQTLREREQARKFAADYIDKLFVGKIPPPSNGDCWGCLLFPSGGGDHIREHIRERYYVPSLVERAVKFAPVSPYTRDLLSAVWIAQTPEHEQANRAREMLKHQRPDNFIIGQVRKSLIKFIYHELGL